MKKTKIRMRAIFLFAVVTIMFGFSIMPKYTVDAATCKTDTYHYYFLTHYNSDKDYEELLASTSENPIIANSAGLFVNLWGKDAKVVSEVMETSFTDADIKMYWDLIIKGDYIKDSDGYHIYHQSGFSINDGDLVDNYTSTQIYVKDYIKNTNSSEYDTFEKGFKKALINPVKNLSSVSLDRNTLNDDEIKINVKRVFSADNLASDFERYNLVYDDIDGYVYYSPMKYSITVEHDCEEEELEENVQTFDLPIFIVWGVGGAALIYSIYYFTKYYKSQKENV